MSDPDQVLDIKDRIRMAMFSGMSMCLRDDLCEMLDELWMELASQEEDIYALRAALDRAEDDKAAAVEAERERCAAMLDAEADKCDNAARWGGHKRYVTDCKAAAYALRDRAAAIRAGELP